MSVTYASSGIIVANALAVTINEIETGNVAKISLDDIYDVSNVDNLSILVSPLTTVLERDAKSIVRERVATQITYIKKIGRDIESIDSMIKKIESLQRCLFFSDIISGSKRWIIDQIELIGNTKTTSGERFDGIFDGDDLGDASVFKSNLIVASSRFLMRVNA